jgi:hypothetical protein
MGREIQNVAASVRQRLLNLARSSNRPFNEVLQHFAMERFLRRLAASEHAERFVLKGALMMRVWRVPSSRPTMDIDLLGRLDNDIDTIVTVTRELCGQSVELDGMRFDPATVEGGRIAEDAEYDGVRVRFRGCLGTAQVHMQLDIGFGDAVTPGPVPADYPTILDLPPPRLQGYPRETVVAEKFHAMAKRGLLNSRMRDFFDLWVLAGQFEFDAATLSAAIRNTFARRGMPVPVDPPALTAAFAEDAAKQTQWRAFVRKSLLAQAPKELRDVVAPVAAFLRPVITVMAGEASVEGEWKPGGPWSMDPDR